MPYFLRYRRCLELLHCIVGSFRPFACCIISPQICKVHIDSTNNCNRKWTAPRHIQGLVCHFFFPFFPPSYLKWVCVLSTRSFPSPHTRCHLYRLNTSDTCLKRKNKRWILIDTWRVAAFKSTSSCSASQFINIYLYSGHFSTWITTNMYIYVKSVTFMV